jgi:hypothetical protein
MGCFVLCIANRFAVFRSWLWIAKSDRFIDSRMTLDVRGIVRQSTQREGVLVGALALMKQLKNKVPGADLVHEVTEPSAPKWMVAEILDNPAPVSVCVCLFDLVFRKSWEMMQ